MANISDIIEEFIKSTFEGEDFLQLSRNELANYFSVAPSQINYVLSTRFTPDKGYIVESKRGGGGCIKVIKIVHDKDSLVKKLYDSLSEIKMLTFNKAQDMLHILNSEDMISDNEYRLLSSTISDKALSFPINVASHIRLQIMKELLIELSKRSVL